MKIALIICNGKSSSPLIKDNFNSIPSNVDTFGTTIAYRYFKKINWWPTYYVSCDPKVVNNHKENLKQLMLDPSNPVKKWFICDGLCKGFFEDSPKFSKVKHSSTGFGATTIALNKIGNYDEIWLIGADNTYTWETKWIKRIGPGNAAEFIADVEDHPNYAIPYYLQKGDVFSFEPKTNNHHPHSSDWKKLNGKEIIFDYSFKDNKLSFRKRSDIIKDLKKL